MKIAATILLLAIGVACISAGNVTVWGDIRSTKLLSVQNVVLTSKDYTLNYRPVRPD